MLIRSFNLTTTKGQVIGVPVHSIIMALQKGSNLVLTRFGKPNIEVVGLVSDLLTSDKFFPVSVGLSNLAVNVEYLDSYQTSNNVSKTDLFFSKETGLNYITVTNTLSEVLALINATIPSTSELGGYSFTDATHTVASPQVFLQDVPQIWTNDKNSEFNIAAPSYASDWWNPTNNTIQPDNGNLDFYTARVDFTVTPSNNNAFFVMQLDIGGTQGVIWENTLPLPRGAGVPGRKTVSMDFFTAGTFFANGGNVVITAKSGNCDIYNKSILIQKLRKV